MTISNEPGYYEDGGFGIRIENICVTVKKDTPNNFLGQTFLGFETVSLVILYAFMRRISIKVLFFCVHHL